MDDDARIRRLAARAVASVAAEPANFQPSLASTVLAYLLRGDTGGTSFNNERPVPEVPQGTLSTSLNERFAAAGKRSQPEQVLFIAAYRLEVEGMPDTSIEDIRAAYRSLRIPPPRNISEQVARCVRRAWLTSGADRAGSATWRTTQKGMSIARERMQQDG